MGSDHAGFLLKEALKEHIVAMGHEIVDVGTNSEDSTDYPLYAAAAARKVATGEVDRAIVACGSGVGVCMAANKIEGARAVNAHDTQEAILSRHHNDANVLALAGRRLNRHAAGAIVEVFLETDFEGDRQDGERHIRRVAQMGQLDRGELQ